MTDNKLFVFNAIFITLLIGAVFMLQRKNNTTAPVAPSSTSALSAPSKTPIQQNDITAPSTSTAQPKTAAPTIRRISNGGDNEYHENE